MRLIDADAFKDYIRNAYEQVKHMYPDGGIWAKQITEDFCKDIDEQPTIEERKTGQWTYANGKPATIGASYCVVCDQCGEESEYCTLYCPNCGSYNGGGA